MVVYKIERWYQTPRRGLVTKETAKQYKVREGSFTGKPCDWSRHEYTWRKEDCFADIDSASSALIARAECNLESARREVDRCISALDVARKWARRKMAESQATDA